MIDDVYARPPVAQSRRHAPTAIDSSLCAILACTSAVDSSVVAWRCWDWRCGSRGVVALLLSSSSEADGSVLQFRAKVLLSS